MCNHHLWSLEIVYAHIIDGSLLVYQAFMHEGEKGVSTNPAFLISHYLKLCLSILF